MPTSLPVRYPSGVTTYAYADTLGTFPSVNTPGQFVINNGDFTPYLSTEWTTTQTNGTVAAYPWNSGVVKLSTTGTTAADAVYLTGTMSALQFRANNRMWFACDVAIPSTSATDITFRTGLSDTVNPASAANGVLFRKPLGGTAVHLDIIKGGVTTSILNIADLSKPSGIYGSGSVAGTMTANATGTTLTALNITSAGSGYQKDPLVVINGTAGTGATGRVEIGTTNGGLNNAGLLNAVVTSAGSGYTAGTFTAEIDHFIRLSFYYDARGVLWVGVGRTVQASFGRNGVNSVVTGGTIDASVTSPDSYTTPTQLATGQTFYPVAGDFMNVAPLVTMFPAVGFLNSTANPRAAYVDQFLYAGEY
jgi:hypothetical protein